MKLSREWAKDWENGIDVLREHEISYALVGVFMDYWSEESIEEKSKSTKNRNLAALHALGGHIVEREISEQSHEGNGYVLVLKYIDACGGPLVHTSEEAWQKELDIVCRKLFKFLQKKG